MISDKSGPKELTMKLTRVRLERLVDDLIQKTLGLCEVALHDASLQTSEIDEVLLVGGMTRMPRVAQAVRNFFGKEPHKGVNPDEVVAAGAAVQAAVLNGNVKDVLLLDVVPSSLGVEALGVYRRLVYRNTTIPTIKSQVFQTAEDDQNVITIRVFQGERETPADNKLLGGVDLVAISPTSCSLRKIEVTLEIPAPGIVHVSALNRATNKAYSTRLALGALSQEDIFRMAREVGSWTATVPPD
jgi:molecular chaperone DnaK